MTAQLLREVANWKLEASLEDNQRYFFESRDVPHILSGNKCFVCGRKGTGKTAIVEHLLGRVDAQVFSEKLSFRNFPFNDLYELTNERYSRQNRYITLWKWLIYCSVARMMIRNQSIDSRVRARLEQVFPEPDMKTLARSVGRWTNPEFRLDLFGLKLTATAKRVDRDSPAPWIQKCDVLEDVIAQHLDSTGYYLVFDNLDEDFEGMSQPDVTETYLNLLRGLFKAVLEIRTVFPQPRYRLFPVLFLRDDIYDLVTDSEKGKWNDLLVRLDWRHHDVRDLVSFRIARAADANATPGSWADMQSLLFHMSPTKRSLGKRFHGAPIHWAASFTLGRPRDFVSILRSAAEGARRERCRVISATHLYNALIEYSSFLLADIQDEVRATLPEIEGVMDALRLIGLPMFSASDFERMYGVTVLSRRRTDAPLPSPSRVLDVLFRFAVIGNQSTDGSTRSRLEPQGVHARFDPNSPILLLRGLHVALGLPHSFDSPVYLAPPR